ncbi:hypothetical protein K2X40_04350 [Candidatus Babeliales bacterium]|nr:hypothetical protein [Candidatus Babeliales bacterium]
MKRYFLALAFSLTLLPIPSALSKTLENTGQNTGLVPCKKMNNLIATRAFEQSLNQQMTLAELLEQLEKINDDIENIRDLERHDVDEIYRVLLKKKEYIVAQLRSIESVTRTHYLEETSIWSQALKLLGGTTVILGVPALTVLACYDPQSRSMQKPTLERLQENFETLKNMAKKS